MYFQHDPFGNLIQVTDVAGNVTSMQYDLRGRKIGMQDPDMGNWTYGYNALGELTQQTDAKGQTTTISYDLLGRIKSKTTPEGTSEWEYDTAANGIGKLHRLSGPNGYEETYSYDAVSRVTQVSTSIAGSIYSVGTAYDQFGRVETITYPSTGFGIRQVYDSYGHLYQVLNASANSLIWQADAADAHSRITSEYFGNGINSQRTYDHDKGTISSIRTGLNGNGQVQDQTFSFDAIGNLLTRSDAIQGLVETFVYDNLNRLVTANGAVTKTYRYDAIGNITYKSDTGYYTYGQDGSKPHAVTAVSGSLNATYVYDANGNMTNGGGRTITYTSFNKPSTITSGGQTTSFSYDPNGNRILKTTSSSTTTYVGKLYERVSGAAGTEHRNYVYAGNSLAAIHSVNGAGVGSNRYIHTSHLDSVDTITDENGNVVERLRFDPFGKRRQLNGEDATGAITSSTTRGFTRHEHDDEVGLINMNARLYDPVLGRFISPDTIVPSSLNSQAFNRYSYVLNNPLSLIDPDGHSWLSKGWKRLKKNVKRFVNKWGRTIVAAVAAYYTFNFTFESLSSWGWAATTGESALVNGSIVIGSGTAAGAASGAVAGGVMCGSECVKQGVRGGAVSGGLFAGADFMSADWNKFGQMTARSTAAGFTADIRGGSFSQGFQSSFGIESLNWAALEMRSRMIAQSSTPICDGAGVCRPNPNATGISVGFRGDGFKLGGCRAPCAEPDIFGGIQGKGGSIFGKSYGPGSFGDLLVESYAGPHDFLNSFMYDAGGNLSVVYQHGAGAIFGDMVSYINVVPATFFVAGSVAQPLVPYAFAINQP